MNIMKKSYNKKYAVSFLFVAMSSVLFGLSPVPVKRLLDGGFNVQLSLALRFFLVSLFGGGICLFFRRSLRVTKKQLFLLAFFGISGNGITNLLLSLSYLYIDMGMATMCHFSYPVLVMIGMVLIFREPFPWKKVAAVILSTCGIVLLAKTRQSGPLKGIFVAVASGVAYGIYVVSLDKTELSALETPVIVCYVGAFCSLFFWLLCFVTGERIAMPGYGEWIYIAAASLIGGSAMFLLNLGIRGLGASTAAFVNMLEPITNLVADMVIYMAFPTPMGWLGCILILASILFVSAQSEKDEKSLAGKEQIL